MRRPLYVFVVLVMILVFSFQWSPTEGELDPAMELADLVENLSGQANPNRPDTTIAGVSVENGRSLVFEGVAEPPAAIWKPPRRISKFFTCNACHNSTREDPDLTDINPEARLQYAIDNGIPYLPGSTFWGIVNRENFYNDDYEKKYGQLVFATRNNLREAVQLCATECSQGRLLEDWELESILAYFWELGLKVSDLDLDEAEANQLKFALDPSSDSHLKKEALTLLRTKYPLRYPATFVPPPSTPEERLQATGNPHRGEKIYKLSCQHCHYQQNFSYLLLDDSRMTFRYLYNHIPDYDQQSIHQVIRYGTPPMSGKHAYMPQYTLEKMSRQQVQDLVTFIALEAGKL